MSILLDSELREQTQITIWTDKKQLHTTAGDNGHGLRSIPAIERDGTSIMHVRAKVIGAQIQTVSKPGEGTKVMLTIGVGSEEMENIPE